MTISSTIRKAGPFIGDGAVTVFPFSFKVFAASDMVVVQAITSTGVETIKALTADYTVALNADQNAIPGGMLTMLVAPPTGTTLTFTSAIANLQSMDLTNAGGFYPKVINDAMDRATIQIQQLAEKLSRALQFALSSSGAPVLPIPTIRAGTFLAFDANGNPVSASGTGNDSALRADIAAPGGSSLFGFLQAGAGAVLRTLQSKVREFVSIVDFGAVGDGVTNDTAALTSFFNSAILRPGVEHRLEAKTYAVNAQLPTINVSNVMIIGAGAMIHNSTGAGPIPSGTIIKWIGAAGATMQIISSVSGATNQKITGIRYTGVTLDCNSLAAFGLKFFSIDKSIIEAGEMNATASGFYIGVVAALDDARDCQNNNFRLFGRQIEAAGGACLQTVGDEGANVSLNKFHCDFLHMNVPAIQLYGDDNNDFDFVRLYKPPAGTATSGINCNAGATARTTARAIRFHYLVSTMPLYALGTESGLAIPSTSISINNLDTVNGTPNPIVGVGASVNWKKDTTPFGDTTWVSYTPTITAGAGAFTTVSATGKYLMRGKIVHVQIAVGITNNGTASSYINATLPFVESLGTAWVFSGKNNSTGVMLAAVVGGGGSTVAIQRYDGTYSGATGDSMQINGFYAIA